MTLLVHLTSDPITRGNRQAEPLRWVIGPNVSDENRARFSRYFTAVNDQLKKERDEAAEAGEKIQET